MSYENFAYADSVVNDGSVVNNGSRTGAGSRFIELLQEDMKRKTDPNSWLLPELRIVDSDPAKPTGEVPAKPAGDVPAKPAGDVPAKPAGEVPAKPAGEVPAKPAGEVPAKPAGEVPAKPAGDVPAKPTGDVPAKATGDAPAKAPGDSPVKTETWGRFGRQFSCDANGNAVYEVRKGDTYSAVARDVLEKRNGRTYDVKNSVDRDEILKFSKELADLNKVKWGKNNFVLIHPGDKIRIPAVQKPPVNPADAKPPRPPETRPPEQKLPPSAHEFNHAIKPNEPSVVAGAFSIQPQNKLYNLLQPPGFEGQPGQSWTDDLKVQGKAYDIDKRSIVFSRDFSNGDKQYIYSGEVDTGFMSGTDFKAAEVVDSRGRIIARKIEYAEPIKMRINAPSSQYNEVKVMAVESRFDPKTGIYEARYKTKDGQIYSANYSGDGTVLLR